MPELAVPHPRPRRPPPRSAPAGPRPPPPRLCSAPRPPSAPAVSLVRPAASSTSARRATSALRRRFRPGHGPRPRRPFAGASSRSAL